LNKVSKSPFQAIPDDPIDRLVASYRPGHGLPRAFYLEPAIHQRDMERLFRRHWHCLAHESVVPNRHDFERFSLGGEDIILTRDGNGRLHALLNSCRHKGAAVCTEAKGNARAFVCPYHAWTYGNDGALKAARLMGDGFDRGAHGLHRLHLRVEAGLVFVTFAENPLDFTAAADLIRTTCGVYGWDRAKVVARTSYAIAANWKIAVENYVECYHCGPAHPEYSETHVLEQPPEEIEALNAAMAARTRALGLTIGECSPWETSDTGREAIRSYRYALKAGVQTASADGKPLAPLMGQFTDYDGGITSLHFGGMSYMALYPDHGVIYRFIPTGVDTCEMELSWLVAGDAVEGRDYDLDRLTWLWRVTSDEDKAIIESTGRGVRSHYYTPGPIAPMEAQTQRLISWYLAELARP
jgi:phenylpropionate dioxygenase-like ring-hydroxylating dioxygenase large terminal subunit